MNFFRIVVMLFLMAPVSAGAADVYEDFSDDSGGFSNGFFQVRSEDGRYAFDGSSSISRYGSGAGIYTVWQEEGEGDLFEDFQAQVDVTWEGGKTNYGYGIIVCALQNDRGSDDMVRLLITKGGSYAVIQDLDGALEYLVRWRRSSLISGTEDVLGVEKEGDEFSFFINGTEVEQLVINDTVKGFIGIEAPNVVYVSFDNFTVTDFSGESVCGVSNPDGCLSESACEEAGGSWCDGACGSEACDDDTCASFNATGMTLDVPCLNMGSTHSLELAMQDGDHQELQLASFTAYDGPVDEQCATYDSSSEILSLPCLDLGTRLWMEFALSDTEPVSFRLAGYGAASELADNDSDGVSVRAGDCNDNDADISPYTTEICGDGIDQDCDGSDEVCLPEDVDNDGDGYTENQGDCNDGNANMSPSVTEICGDGIDQDCDGEDLVCNEPPPDDGAIQYSGSWSYVSTDIWVNPGNAGCTGETEHGSLTISQEGDILQILNTSEGEYIEGTIRGDSLVIDWTVDGTTTSGTLQINSCDSVSGTLSWSYARYGYYCNGVERLTVTRNGPCP